MGNAKVRVPKVRANGESSVTLKISQLLVIICIFIAMKDTNDPIQSHLKSLYERVSSMFANLSFLEDVESVSTPLAILGFSLGRVIRSYNVPVGMFQKVPLSCIHVNYFMYLCSLILCSYTPKHKDVLSR